VQPLLLVKAISITYAEDVFVALCIQQEMRLRRIVNCALSGCAVFFTLSHKRHAFRKSVTYLLMTYLLTDLIAYLLTY
jgi:hypothetical protein